MNQFMTAPENVNMYASPLISPVDRGSAVNFPYNSMTHAQPKAQEQFSLPQQMGAAFPQDSVPLNMPIKSSGQALSPQFSFTVEEIPFYSNLWRIANPQLRPFLENGLAAEFLKNSGLEHTVLHHIWELACSNNPTAIDQECFFLVLRLIAFAQSGQMVTSQHMFQAPPQLPVFVNVSRQRDPSEISDGSLRSLPYIADQTHPTFMGDVIDSNFSNVPISPLNPTFNLPASPAISPKAADIFASIGGLSLGPAVLQHGLLTETEKNKYTSLFASADVGGLGYLPPSDVRRIMEKSGLPASTLRQIWDMADNNSDGRLDEREFVVAMHLASRAKKNVPLPNELPASLLLYLTTGELPVLPDGSASADSPKSVQDTTGAMTVPAPPIVKDEKIDKFDSFEPASFGEDLTFEPPPAKSKKDKKKKKGIKFDMDGGFDDAFDTGFGEPEKKFGDFEIAELPMDGFKDTVFDGGIGEVGASVEEPKWSVKDDKDTSSILEAIIEGDKRLTKSLKGEVAVHSDSLRNMQNVGDTLHRELVKERLELEKQIDRKKEFERQVYDYRQELDKLKDDRRKVDMERLSVARDLDHYQEEIVFLKRQIDETYSDISLIKESSKMIESNAKTTDLQLAHLEKTRKDILSAVKAEKDQLAQEQAEISQMKVQLDRMKREKEECQTNHQLLQERFRQADQDRLMMLSGLESEQNKLNGLRQERLKVAKEKTQIQQDMTDIAQQTWMQGRPVMAPTGAQWNPDNFKDTPASRPDDIRGGSSWGSAVIQGAPGSNVRDRKGIPVSTVVALDQSDSPSRSSDWMSFGQSVDKKNAQRCSYERRGIEGILNKPTGGHPLTDWPRSEDDVKTDKDGWREKDKKEDRLGGRETSWTAFSQSDTPSFGKLTFR